LRLDGKADVPENFRSHAVAQTDILKADQSKPRLPNAQTTSANPIVSAKSHGMGARCRISPSISASFYGESLKRINHKFR
jgi:hypothetical protein